MTKRGPVYNFTSLQALVYKEVSKTDGLEISETHIIDGDDGDYAGFFKIDGYTLTEKTAMEKERELQCILKASNGEKIWNY